MNPRPRDYDPPALPLSYPAILMLISIKLYDSAVKKKLCRKIMIKDLQYNISAEIWMYKGKGAWFFVTLPNEESAQVKFLSGNIKRGWGAVRVVAKIGNTIWKTSIFPSSELKAYILPIKAEIRKKEKIGAGDVVQIQLDVSL